MHLLILSHVCTLTLFSQQKQLGGFLTHCTYTVCTCTDFVRCVYWQVHFIGGNFWDCMSAVGIWLNVFHTHVMYQSKKISPPTNFLLLHCIHPGGVSNGKGSQAITEKFTAEMDTALL